MKKITQSRYLGVFIFWLALLTSGIKAGAQNYCYSPMDCDINEGFKNILIGSVRAFSGDTCAKDGYRYLKPKYYLSASQKIITEKNRRGVGYIYI